MTLEKLSGTSEPPEQDSRHVPSNLLPAHPENEMAGLGKEMPPPEPEKLEDQGYVLAETKQVGETHSGRWLSGPAY